MRHLFCYIFILYSFSSSAQDIKGAYIRTAWVTTFTYTYEYTYTLTLLTDGSKQRPTATLYYGDSNHEAIPLISENVVNGITIKTYTSSHIYSGPSGDPPLHFKTVFVDSFRVNGINNISNSGTESIKTEARIYASLTAWTKSAGTLDNFPPTLGLSGNNVFYDPMFIKEVGTDSVSYSLGNCYASNYYKPSNATLDPVTGILTFSKDSVGLYAFYIEINEWVKNTTGQLEISRRTFVDFVIDINNTVGISEIENKDQIIAFPNPFESDITFKLPDSVGPSCYLEIYNALGQNMINSILTERNFKVDCENFKPGVYLYSLRSENGFYKFGKIIKR